jgi:hypothetical protein
VRKNGGGRNFVENTYTGIEEDIRKLIDGSTHGNPERVLSYTTESLRKIESELKSMGIQVSHETVGKILQAMGYSKQANRKMLQVGETHPDRNAQFEHNNTTATEYIETGDPVISVDTKKKEAIGNFKNNGQEYCRKKEPRNVLDHDFPLKELDNLRDQTVRRIADEAMKMKEVLGDFKKRIREDIYAFTGLAAEQYGKNWGGKKGNCTLATYDGKYRLVVAMNDTIYCGPVNSFV